MRIAIASSSLLVLPVLDAISSSSHELVAIITTPDAPQGRGREVLSSELASWADQKGYLLYKYAPETIRDFLLEQKIELVITLSFGKIVKEPALSTPRFGWLNIHFSQLPRWRGAAPVQRAILAGDKNTGISIFRLDPGMDTGPVYAITNRELSSEVTTESLLSALAVDAQNEILTVIQSILDGKEPTEQNDREATYAEKINPKMGAIDWNDSAKEIARQVRALSGNVGTYTTLRGVKINLYGAEITSHHVEEIPGTPIISGAKNERLAIACRDAVITFELVKPAGKSLMKSEDFLRGARLHGTERFE